MGFVTEYFDATLTAKLPADAVSPTLSESAVADLTSLLSPDGAYTYLSLKSDHTYEVVKARLSGGLIYFERGQEGTAAVLHPLGTCVSAISPLTLAVIKAMACEYDCCEGDCVCDPVEFAGSAIPTAIVGKAWEGAAMFTGTLPIVCTANGLPSWVNVSTQNNMLKLSGTPTQPGTYSFTVAAANCNGTAVASRALTLDVTA